MSPSVMTPAAASPATTTRKIAKAIAGFSHVPNLEARRSALLRTDRLARGVPLQIEQRPRRPFPRSLDEVCHSPGAKLYAKRAEDLIAAGELERATSELYRALRAEEGENPELLERIHAVTALARLGSQK